MFAGIFFALTACFLWGLLFLVPQWMPEFSPLEIALGRYFVYGIISALMFLKMICHRRFRYSTAVWIKASYFSLVTTIVYFTCLVLGLRYSSPAVCALVLGVSPIAIAFYGNWQQKETSFKSLILPAVLIVIGLVIVNVPHLETTDSKARYLLGVLFSFMALMAWSWYVVANSRFMKTHPKIMPNEWSTLIGVATLGWVLMIGVILTLFFADTFPIQKYITPSDMLVQFWVGSLMLGILCSWVGASLWNKASLHLPVSLAGQLTVFETIFGVIFVYVAAQTWPSWMEAVGIVILLSSVVYGIRHFSKRQAKVLSPH